MVAKARCHKCQNRFDVVDWKEGERPPCPVCGYPLTASGKKHTKLIVLVSVLILLGLTVGGIILANNNSEQNKKTSLQTAKKEKMLMPPTEVEKTIKDAVELSGYKMGKDREPVAQ